jgi:hypothetical protein
MQQAPEGAREWLSQMQNLSEQIQLQQQNSQQMMQELMNTYMQLLNTPGSYGKRRNKEDQQEKLWAIFFLAPISALLKGRAEATTTPRPVLLP